MKKKLKLLLVIIIIIIIACLTIFKDKSYTKVYDIDNYHITEEFTHDAKIYYFQIKHDSITYEFIANSKYKGKELITAVEKISEDQETCLIPKNELTDVILCSNGDNLINWNLTSEKIQSQIPSDLIYTYSDNYEEYNDLKVYNQLDKQVYIWNYKGFDYFFNNSINTENIFDKDVYETDLITALNEYILIPNYNQEYNFNEIYLLNTTNGKIKTWELDYDISEDSYIMGTHDKSVYLVDCKNKIQYELVPHKQKMRLIATENKQGLVYDGEWQKEKVSTIVNKSLKFTKSSDYNYTIENNKLYLYYQNAKNKIAISNQSITKIISQNNDEVVYLSENKLYYFNPIKGEILLAEKEEWLFNSNNKIFMIF